jgi:hypothetical protein
VDDSQIKTYAADRNVGDSVYFKHGTFSGVGNDENYSIVINRENYPNMGFVVNNAITDWDHLTGKVMVIRLKMYFGANTYTFEYSLRTNPALGHVIQVDP